VNVCLAGVAAVVVAEVVVAAVVAARRYVQVLYRCVYSVDSRFKSLSVVEDTL